MDLPPVKSHLAQPLLREALLTLTLFRTSWQASFFKYWVSWKKKENLHSGFLSNHFSLSFFSLSVLHKHSNFTCESKKKKKTVPLSACKFMPQVFCCLPDGNILFIWPVCAAHSLAVTGWRLSNCLSEEVAARLPTSSLNERLLNGFQRKRVNRRSAVAGY